MTIFNPNLQNEWEYFPVLVHGMQSHMFCLSSSGLMMYLGYRNSFVWHDVG